MNPGKVTNLGIYSRREGGMLAGINILKMMLLTVKLNGQVSIGILYHRRRICFLLAFVMIILSG